VCRDQQGKLRVDVLELPGEEPDACGDRLQRHGGDPVIDRSRSASI